MLGDSYRVPERARWFLALAVVLTAIVLIVRPAALAQQPPPAEGGASAAAGDVPPGSDPSAASSVPGTTPKKQGEAINFLDLLISGGGFMVPIVFMSLLGATFTVERLLGLRRSRLMPEDLVTQLGQLGSGREGFDPRQAYRVCQQFPCAAAAVIRAMLVKIGRPHSEIEHAVAEASEREAERAYANVRWLSLCTAVAPLLGLLGTVWGMIVAFHETTQLAPGQDRAQQLAEGIYIALVTTLAGLMVAIPTALLAHFFEGRIIAVFHEIDELLFNLLPLVERYEGRVRFTQNVGEGLPAGLAESSPMPPAADAGSTPPGAKTANGR
jgi:biopolymer transport protein ExbB